jgi:hypothetical protein
VTWAEKGLKQVAIVGMEEKRAFTVMVTITSDGNFLPIQAIYSGKTSRSCPSPNSPHHKDLIDAGCLIQESGTKTYWSNLRTMKDFVNKILAPYFDRQKIIFNLPSSQKSLWTIDVWSVHRSKEFRRWMKETHPTIIISASRSGPVPVLSPSGLEPGTKPVPESFRNQGPRTRTAKNRKKPVQTGYDRSCNKYLKMRYIPAKTGHGV